MHTLRLYDAARHPPNWTDIVQSTQFVAFASDADSSGSLDAAGQPFPATDEATCLVFDSLAEARQFCEARVLTIDSIRFEVFDGRGRVDEPLLVIVSPTRAAALESSPRSIRVRKWAAVALLVAAGPLVYYDYRTSRGALVLPTFLGISMALAALRLLFMNLAVREAEQARRRRLEPYE